MRVTTPSDQPFIIVSHSENTDFVCHAKIIGTDGKVMDLSITRETAQTLLTELIYHMRRQEERIADAPVEIPTTKAEG